MKNANHKHDRHIFHHTQKVTDTFFYHELYTCTYSDNHGQHNWLVLHERTHTNTPNPNADSHTAVEGRKHKGAVAEDVQPGLGADVGHRDEGEMIEV